MWPGSDQLWPKPAHPRFFSAARTPQTGSCDDPINYASWQVVLSLLCGAG